MCVCHICNKMKQNWFFIKDIFKTNLFCMAHVYILHNYTVLCIICIVFSSSICIKDQLGNILPQLSHLEEGLQTCGLLASIRAYPKLWEPVFVIGKGHQVTDNSLIDSFELYTVRVKLNNMKEITHSALIDCVGFGLL